MEMNLEEIEQRHARTKLIRAAFGGGMSQGIDDVDWLIAEVKRLRDERDSFQRAEKEISDAYLRIREIVGAWDTNMGGENRYEVTENAVRTLKEENISLNEYIEQLEYDLSTIPKFLHRSVREKALKTYRDMQLGKENEDERE